MKKSIFALLTVLLLSSTAFSAPINVGFAWDPSPGDVEGYRIHQGKRGGPYTQRGQVLSPATTMTVSIDKVNGRCFVATAYDGSIISGYSNEVCLQPDAPGVLRFTP